MKTLVLVLAALTVTSTAFAQAGGPVRSGNKCWAATDQRGFGFWDKCASGQLLTEINRREGLRNVAAPVSPVNAFQGGGGDGGGGGGGGR